MSEFSDTIERLFSIECSPQQVRAIEAGSHSLPLWEKIAESEFHNALVNDAQGGVGLSLPEVFDVLCACGAYCLPLPLPITMMARAVLAEAGVQLADGPITVATVVAKRGDKIVCERVPYALTARWVLAVMGDSCALLPADKGKLTHNGVHASLEGRYEFEVGLFESLKFQSSFDWQAACAALMAAQMAGAMERVLTDTIRYANERSQFGKSIGKFQAIQQQISVMAEQVFAARMAAQLGCSSADYRPEARLAGIAKARTSEAVATVTAVAHAVHGAMGITEEYNLQLSTRRLHEWRLDFGSEGYWHRKLGQDLLAGARDDSVSFIRAHLAPNPT